MVVLGERRVQVLPARQLYRTIDPELAEQAGTIDEQFIGEERLTGTLVSLALDTPPLVVFVTSSRGSALSEQNGFAFVAERLRTANFEVTEWNALGQMVPTLGQRIPPGEVPVPEPGQKAVYIVTPPPHRPTRGTRRASPAGRRRPSRASSGSGSTRATA